MSTDSKTEVSNDSSMDETQAKGRQPGKPWQILLMASAIAAILLSIYQLFNLGTIFGYTLLGNQYLYFLIALLMPLTFIFWPLNSKERLFEKGEKRTGWIAQVPFYDVILFALSLACGLFLAANAETIIYEGWEYAAPDNAIWMSYLLWALVLDAARRVGGMAIFVIVLALSFYPLYAGDLPDALSGQPVPLADTAIYHTMSEESLLGIPMRAFGNLVVGFLIFGVALQYTGGGQFFLNLAFALLGKVRGGPAKVAIFSSGLMGSMSGSVITNVLTTGVMTIPAMRKVGFARSYAAGVETCASTGGVLMPPIMGATAFVMATFLEVPYIDIAIAAVIPSALYFFGLFMQIDAYAARVGLEGLPKTELPSLKQTMKEGWYFVVVFILLIWMLIGLNQESWAPYYATALLIGINQVFPYHRWGWQDLKNFITGTGRLFVELTSLLGGIGLIVGALVVTGKLGNIANDLLSLAGGNVYILLLMGAATSFLLGIGMTVTAAYIFLAVALAPALIKGGLDPMAVHLFILYWGMLSYITPPVALGAFAASTIAQCKPMSAGFQAMRLGTIIYFIPFFFVFDTAFLLRGDAMSILTTLVDALLGITLLAAALQGYLLRFGSLGSGPLALASRIILGVAGIFLAVPGGGLVPLDNLELWIVTLVLTAIALGLALMAPNSRYTAIGLNKAGEGSA
ncbi:TRAP transporter permease [Rhodovibrionaceae bacterium A322]